MNLNNIRYSFLGQDRHTFFDGRLFYTICIYYLYIFTICVFFTIYIYLSQRYYYSHISDKETETQWFNSIPKVAYLLSASTSIKNQVTLTPISMLFSSLSHYLIWISKDCFSKNVSYLRILNCIVDILQLYAMSLSTLYCTKKETQENCAVLSK